MATSAMTAPMRPTRSAAPRPGPVPTTLPTPDGRAAVRVGRPGGPPYGLDSSDGHYAGPASGTAAAPVGWGYDADH